MRWPHRLRRLASSATPPGPLLCRRGPRPAILRGYRAPSRRVAVHIHTQWAFLDVSHTHTHIHTDSLTCDGSSALTVLRGEPRDAAAPRVPAHKQPHGGVGPHAGRQGVLQFLAKRPRLCRQRQAPFLVHLDPYSHTPLRHCHLSAGTSARTSAHRSYQQLPGSVELGREDNISGRRDAGEQIFVVHTQERGAMVKAQHFVLTLLLRRQQNVLLPPAQGFGVTSPVTSSPSGCRVLVRVERQRTVRYSRGARRVAP